MEIRFSVVFQQMCNPIVKLMEMLLMLPYTPKPSQASGVW